METATWIGVGIGVVLVALNIVGWFLAYNRYSRNEARHLGRLEGKVDGLNTRMESMEERMGNLERRLDTFITNWPGDVGE